MQRKEKNNPVMYYAQSSTILGAWMKEKTKQGGEKIENTKPAPNNTLS